MTIGTEPAARDVAAFLARRRADVDAELERLLPGGEEWPSHLHRAIRHSVFAGGKRLRPILCLAAGEVLGARTEDLLAPACGLEMIHTYSLIHDDLPALDNDDLRRGVPTCHVVFGEATAILAGDSLLTHGLGHLRLSSQGGAFRRGQGPGPRDGRRRDRHPGHDRRPGGGPRGREGSRSDGRARLEDPREQDRQAHPRVALGRARSWRGPPEETLALVDLYGRKIGLAFQIKDDLLDVESDAATLGKASGKDAAAGKATFPGVWGVEKSRQLLTENVAEAVEAASALPGGGGVLPDLARFVGSRTS